METKMIKNYSTIVNESLNEEAAGDVDAFMKVVEEAIFDFLEKDDDPTAPFLGAIQFPTKMSKLCVRAAMDNIIESGYKTSAIYKESDKSWEITVYL